VNVHPGFNVIGHITGNLGLGVLARQTLRALADGGYPVSALDVDPGQGRASYDLSPERFLVSSPDALPHGINLFVLPAISFRFLVPKLEALVLDESRLNVALPMWELSVLPMGWKKIYEFFDALVAGSAFIRSTLDFSLSNTFVVEGMQPLELPSDVAAARDRFDIPEEAIVFLAAYEPHSDPVRKNPEGVVRAFLKAFADCPDTRLIVKANNAYSEQGEHPSLTRLRRLAAGSNQILFLTDALSYSDVLSLLASVDVVVSLHRAEGLGLLPMEAMALGKPVIVTGWSGNMSYTRHANACLVDYQLVPVPETAATYHRLLGGVPATWAEPNLETAVAWMKKLAGDAAFRQGLGLQAKTSIEAFNAEARLCTYAEELATIFRNRDILCPKVSERVRRLKALRRPFEKLVPEGAATAQLAELLAQNQALSGELQAAQAKLADIQTSTSWRLTAPLRSVVDYARGFRDSSSGA